jgi:HSP20 family protein
MSAMRTMGLAPVLPPEASVDTSTNEYVVHLAVPGFAREELEVEITNRVVTVRGDQTRPALENGPFLLHERVEETFALPADVDTGQVTAAFARGALELHAPRTNGSSGTPRRLPVGKRNAVNADASGV